MGAVYVFVNQKGGVGKTTSTINIGAYLAAAGKKTLLVDFDSQANLSSGVGVRDGSNSIYRVISGAVSPAAAVQKTPMEGLFVLPSSLDLSGAAVELISEEASERNFFLKKAVDALRSDFDFILIDCPPSLGILTINGMCAADKVLIPMQCEYFALEGLTQLLESIERIRNSQTGSKKLGILGIFFTMYDQRTRLAQQVVKQVSLYFKDSIFNTIIPRNVRLAEAPSHGLPISLYDENCAGALAYKSLSGEVLERAT
jgi:chromosome partitioning protein